MPSKTSKSPRTPKGSLWKAEQNCSEHRLADIARELACVLKARDRVLLEGPMGAGKSTFARALLLGLGVEQPPEGSPTFAIAHEYSSPQGEVVHIDFYRLKSESEITDAGIEEYFWQRDAITIAEWTSMWPEFETSVLSDAGKNWQVRISFSDIDDETASVLRNIEIVPA